MFASSTLEHAAGAQHDDHDHFALVTPTSGSKKQQLLQRMSRYTRTTHVQHFSYTEPLTTGYQSDQHRPRTKTHTDITRMRPGVTGHAQTTVQSNSRGLTNKFQPVITMSPFSWGDCLAVNQTATVAIALNTPRSQHLSESFAPGLYPSSLRFVLVGLGCNTSNLSSYWSNH